MRCLALTPLVLFTSRYRSKTRATQHTDSTQTATEGDERENRSNKQRSGKRKTGPPSGWQGSRESTSKQATKNGRTVLPSMQSPLKRPTSAYHATARGGAAAQQTLSECGHCCWQCTATPLTDRRYPSLAVSAPTPSAVIHHTHASATHSARHTSPLLARHPQSRTIEFAF